MKQNLWLFVFLFFSISTFAQNNKARIKGQLISKQTNKIAEDVSLFFPKIKQINSTDEEGHFEVRGLIFGVQKIIFIQGNETVDSLEIDINDAQIDLGEIVINTLNTEIESIKSQQKYIPTIALESDPNNLEEEGISAGQNISALLNSSGNRDPFLNAASFVFGQYNFRTRGYDRSTQQISFNGISMNDMISGNAVWAQWSGLNDMLRNQQSSYGLTANERMMGGLSGGSYFDLNAIEQTAQTKLSYSLANRTYNNRIMLSHSTGLNKNGWAKSISFSRRWANEAYVSGSSFDGYSGFASISKKINNWQEISLNIIAAYNDRARSGTAIQEVYDLANDNFYNPNWGWQNGVKRNARHAKNFEPIAILNHNICPNKNLQISQSISFQTGQNSATSLDWYNAIDPRPDYYRNLPSYYQNSNPAAANLIEQTLTKSPQLLQINWDRMYAANNQNMETLYGLNGNTGDNLSGKRSLYVVGADVAKMNKYSYGINAQYKANEHWKWSGGLQIAHQKTAYYRQLNDLLGGDYFLNYNMFAAQQFSGNSTFLQNDVQKPNRAVLKGEKYRYDYSINSNKADLWAQAEYNQNRWYAFVSASGGFTNYQRNGQYQNGLFLGNSFGKSERFSFFNYALKAGINYKVNGRNYLLLNAYQSIADQGINNILIAPRTRNQSTKDNTMQQTQSIEMGYLMRAPKLNIRAIGYATDNKNKTTIQRFYNDDPEYQSFVNFVLSGSNSRNIGTEIAVEYAVNSMLSLSAVASIGQSFYTNNPEVQVYNDNDTNTNPSGRKVYINNYFLGIGPQSAYTFGINYNSKKYWYLKLNANYFERNFVAINPSRRSIEAAELVDRNSAQFSKIFAQEILPSFYTIDLSGGKSFRLSKISKRLKYGSMAYLNFGITNLLNFTNIKSFGFEQLRYDFTNNNPDKFPSKYIYGYGRTFFANLSFKF